MARMVNCIKLKREAEGLDFPPYPGELGKKLYECVSKEAWKGWRADVDGRPAKIVRANHAFLGVFVPAGKHAIVDLTKVDFMGSMAIRMFISVSRILREKQAKLALYGAVGGDARLNLWCEYTARLAIHYEPSRRFTGDLLRWYTASTTDVLAAIFASCLCTADQSSPP